MTQERARKRENENTAALSLDSIAPPRAASHASE